MHVLLRVSLKLPLGRFVPKFGVHVWRPACRLPVGRQGRQAGRSRRLGDRGGGRGATDLLEGCRGATQRAARDHEMDRRTRSTRRAQVRPRAHSHRRGELAGALAAPSGPLRGAPTTGEERLDLIAICCGHQTSGSSRPRAGSASRQAGPACRSTRFAMSAGIGAMKRQRTPVAGCGRSPARSPPCPTPRGSNTSAGRSPRARCSTSGTPRRSPPRVAPAGPRGRDAPSHAARSPCTCAPAPADPPPTPRGRIALPAPPAPPWGPPWSTSCCGRRPGEVTGCGLRGRWVALVLSSAP